MHDLIKRGYKDRFELSDAISKSRDSTELRGRFSLLGYEFPDTLELLRLARYAWEESHRDKIKAILNQPPLEPNDLPYSEANVKGTRYKIHGIIHGGLPFPPSKKLRGFVKSSIDKHLKESEVCICEQNLGLTFGFEREFNDISQTSKLYSRGEFTVNIFLSSALLASFLPVLPIGIVYRKLSKPNDEFAMDVKASKEPAYLYHAREIFSLANLPQPLHIEYKHLIHDAESFYYRSMFPERKIASVSARSAYMAGKAMEFAEENRVDTLHLLVGLSHESQIKYFLENPHTSKIYSRSL